jgi:hypothetical protein
MPILMCVLAYSTDDLHKYQISKHKEQTHILKKYISIKPIQNQILSEVTKTINLTKLFYFWTHFFAFHKVLGQAALRVTERHI